MTETVSEIQGKRVREGEVVSSKMNKTIIVLVTRLLKHPKFNKIIKRHIKYSAHDEKNEAKEGNRVQIVETRPISKTKRWRFVKVIKS